ncbi:hypothetical protein CDL15_Pgr019649 [Punica granatum]|uniref:Uncharacterized protein n=1 Tax=Punica granatum TaxID=22663 RepID=A0A218X6M9_PUNGR|nr:hypothetical protein CDL15_Pgr019649 [Punica granatum]
MLPLPLAPLADVYCGLYSTMLASSLFHGVYNPSLQAFSADQLEQHQGQNSLPLTETEQKADKKSLFFQCWYFGICSGSLLGVTSMSYARETFGWVLGFDIPAAAMLASVGIFYCGNRIYAYKADANVDDVAKDRPLIEQIVQAVKMSTSKTIAKKGISLPIGNCHKVELE